MANRTYYPSSCSGLNRVFMEFELLGAGAAAPTIPANGGGLPHVQSIVRSGVGVYVVTMKDAWNRVISKGGDLDDTLNDGGYCTMGNITNEATALPLVVTLYVRAATGILTDAAAARRIAVKLTLRNGVATQGG